MKKENIITGKRRDSLTAEEKRILRNALHTEACLSGNYTAGTAIRVKLGLAALAFEKE
jgi:hypothetical protein